MEVLIIVSIIGLLFAGIGYTFRRQLNRSYDTRRKTDLDLFAKSFETYFNDVGCYPSLTDWNTAKCDSASTFLSSHIDKFRCDPERHIRYVYVPTDTAGGLCEGTCGECYGYQLYAVLSDTNDPAIALAGCNTGGGCGYTDESGRSVNFGIASGGTIASRTTQGSESDVVDLSRLAVFGPTPTPRTGFPITPQPTKPPTDIPVTRKVYVLDFNPVLESKGGMTLRAYKHWSDPPQLEQSFIADVASASGGYLNYRVVGRQSINAIPAKDDGFTYTDDQYLAALDDAQAVHQPDTPIDYMTLLSAYGLCDKANGGQIDEVWLWGGPYFGFWQAVMAGPNADYVTAPPILTSSCTGNLLISGFRYDQGVSSVMNIFGMRAESILSDVFGEYAVRDRTPSTPWGNFTKPDVWFPGEAACGFVNHAPNAINAGNFSSTRTVKDTCDDWYYYPNLTGTSSTISCAIWGCTEYGYHLWWLTHLPKTGGSSDGYYNNWWRYIAEGS